MTEEVVLRLNSIHQQKLSLILFFWRGFFLSSGERMNRVNNLDIGITCIFICCSSVDCHNFSMAAAAAATTTTTLPLAAATTSKQQQ